MKRLKKLHLKNYCGYKDTTFSFESLNGIIPFSVFYGPNGCGKSTCLQAVSLLCSPKNLAGRNLDLLFKSIIHNKDYNPDSSGLCVPEEKMMIHGTFDEDGIEKNIIISASYWIESKDFTKTEHKEYIENNKTITRHNCFKKINEQLSNYTYYHFKGGVEKNDFSLEENKICYFMDADHPINMKKFQIRKNDADLFKEIGESVYGYPCSLTALVVSGSGKNEEHFYTDLILGKGNNQTKVHFKRFSDGEKKIATMLRSLCDSNEINKSDIILIDNIEMHIYFKRHPKLVDKILEKFPNKQFLVTTHSSTLIDHIKNKNKNENMKENTGLFDIEIYKPEQSMTL